VDPDRSASDQTRGSPFSLTSSGPVGDVDQDAAVRDDDRIDRQQALGGWVERFVDHEEKLRKSPNDINRNHWEKELRTLRRRIDALKGRLPGASRSSFGSHVLVEENDESTRCDNERQH